MAAVLSNCGVATGPAVNSVSATDRGAERAAVPLSATRSAFQRGATAAVRARRGPQLRRCRAVVTCDVNRRTNLTELVDPEQVKPQQDRVLVRLQEVAPVSAGGVLLPSSAAKFERYLVGEILAKGPEATEVDVKQKVMFSDVQAYEVSLGSSADRLCFCRAGDLLAVVET